MKNKKINVPILILFTLLLVGSHFGCANFKNEPELKFSKDKISEIDQVIKTLYGNDQFSGTVLVSVKGEVIYKNAFGYANIKDSVLNTCDTKFRIASFTKPFTVMLILQLVEDGKLELDGKLVNYLPGFPKEKGENITIHQLLTHTAGITGESRIPNLIDIEKEYYSHDRLFNCIVEQDIVFQPGRGNEYSNFGYALLGLIIENVSGKSYEELLQEKICKPAGMKNTLGDITAQPIENNAIGYNYNYFTGFEKASFLDMSFVFGYGHLLSTVYDLYLFDKALYSNKLLNEKSKDLFFNKYGWHYQNVPYGKGFKKIRSNSLDGSINGFGSHTQRIEKDTVFIVALRNTKEYKKQIVIKWPGFMISRVLAVMYGEEYDMPKKSGAFEVFKILQESGYVEAANLFKNIKSKQTDKYYLNKREFLFFEDQLNIADMKDMAKAYNKIQLEE
jgi:CubicO group peptidase (beta-lactamase class C family)